MDELGLNDAAVTNLLGLDKNKNYFGGSEKTYQEYSANQSEKILKDIKNTKYVGTVQTSNDDSYTIDGKTYSKKGRDVSPNNLDISKEDYDKIPNGTAFEAKVDEDIKYPEYLKEYVSELDGFKNDDGVYVKNIANKGSSDANKKAADKEKKLLEDKGFIVELHMSGSYGHRYAILTIKGHKNNVKKFYKDIDGKLYKMF